MPVDIPILVVVGIVALTAGVKEIEGAKNRKAAAQNADAQMQAAELLANQTNLTNLEINQAQQISKVINASTSSQEQIDANAIAAATCNAITTQGQAKVCSINNQGNIVLIASSGIFVVSLALIVYKLAHLNKASSSG